MTKTKTKKAHTSKPRLHKVVITSSTFIVVFLVLFVSFYLYFQDRFYPGVSIGNIPVTGLTSTQANLAISKTITSRQNTTLTFYYGNTPYTIDLSNGFTTELDQTINQAQKLGKSSFYLPPKNINLKFEPTSSLLESIDAIALSIAKPAISSEIKIDDNNEVSVTPSSSGEALDKQKLLSLIENYLNSGNLETKTLPVSQTYPKLPYKTALNIKKTLDNLKTTPLKLNYNNQSWELNIQNLLPILDLENSQSNLFKSTGIINFQITDLNTSDQTISDAKLVLKQDKLDNFIQKIASSINKPVKEPLFQFDGAKVVEFQPPQTGLELDNAKTASLITSHLQSNNLSPINLPVVETNPKNKLSNDLGITELIAQGASNFAGSIPNRIYNIKLAASRINGILIAPGDTFSFVNTVGDISAASGYKQAYVIKSGHTVLDDGGGVCQVSTTIFRAALNAGLPIVARTAHAYRVGYYEQGYPPGLDATIFSPTVDFKFKNDTPHHILVQAYTAGTSLFVDLYGTKDGRVTTITKPVVTDQTPPPAALYQDDPTLPKGTTKQVDFAAWGARVSFTRTISKNGQVVSNETFRSNFRPWQAVYLVGTQ